jgi:hypothetical protein
MDTATRIRSCHSCTDSGDLLRGGGWRTGVNGKVGIIVDPHACNALCQCGCHSLWREITNKEVP